MLTGSQYDVIIVGGASAGLTAALYASRQGLKTLVITKDIGGQALLTNEIQNYPGFQEISGFDLISKLQEQSSRYGAEYFYDEVQEVQIEEESCLGVRTSNNSRFRACALILAFGKTPRDMGVPGEVQFKGKGISYCAVCDGPLFKGKTVAVVGSGEPALDAANYLSNVADKVYVIQRTERPIGDEEVFNTVKSKHNVEFINSKIVSKVLGNSRVQSLQLVTATSTKGRSEQVSQLRVDGVFVEMGYATKTEFLHGLVQLNGIGEIITDKDGRTSTPGVFAAGDVTDTAYKQAVISAGQGAAAALSAYNYLQKLKGRPSMRSDWKSVKSALT